MRGHLSSIEHEIKSLKQKPWRARIIALFYQEALINYNYTLKKEIAQNQVDYDKVTFLSVSICSFFDHLREIIPSLGAEKEKRMGNFLRDFASEYPKKQREDILKSPQNPRKRNRI